MAAAVKKRIGISTNAERISEYIVEVYNELARSRCVWRENLSTPLIRNPLEVLFHL